MIPFTRRELETGWRSALNAYRSLTDPTGSKHLLLFYAVECGLKAAILKKMQRETTHGLFQSDRHDLNALMDSPCLRLGNERRLPETVHMANINGNEQRNTVCGDLNQIWRYGGRCTQPKDTELAAKLEKINSWIEGEL